MRPKYKGKFAHCKTHCSWYQKQRIRNRNPKLSWAKNSPGTYLSIRYYKLKSRVAGAEFRYKIYYRGLPLCTSKEFKEWSLADKDFLSLFDTWIKSGYSYKLSPSVERLDKEKGYTLENMMWATKTALDRRASEARNR